jgi:hypothetical protein
MASEETEALEDEVIDMEEQEDTPSAPLDLVALGRDAQARIALMQERGRANIEHTFAGWVDALMKANEQALSEAIRAEAEQRKAVLDQATQSEAYKRKMLCSKVTSGAFDA